VSGGKPLHVFISKFGAQLCVSDVWLQGTQPP